MKSKVNFCILSQVMRSKGLSSPRSTVRSLSRTNLWRIYLRLTQNGTGRVTSTKIFQFHFLWKCIFRLWYWVHLYPPTTSTLDCATSRMSMCWLFVWNHTSKCIAFSGVPHVFWNTTFTSSYRILFLNNRIVS